MKAVAGPSTPKVAVVGAGIVGLSIAWRLAQRNIEVIVFDSAESGRGASMAAAGMLSVAAETMEIDRGFFELCRASRSLWPEFARSLKKASGLDLDLREQGTLLVALTEQEAESLRALAQAHRADGTLAALDRIEWQTLEPQLTPYARAVFMAPQDGQVDNQVVVRALLRALAGMNVKARICEPVQSVRRRDPRGFAVDTAIGRYEFDHVVLATGAETDTLIRSSALESVVPSVTPVKGQTIALQMDPRAPLVRHVVRGETHYLVPRSSGVLIAGATSEVGVRDLRADPKASEFLLEGARQLVPATAGLPCIEARVGLRPLCRGGIPVLGEVIPGLFLAIGHYRNGVLLAPITAEIVAGLVTESLSDELSFFAAQYKPEIRRALSTKP